VGTGDYANGWDKWDKAKTDAMFDDGERSVANAVNGGMRNMAKGMSPLLANRKFNTIMGAFGSGNIMTEVNHQSALNEFDNTDAVADIIGKKTTNTIMAGIGGYGNVMVKVGDGGFYGVAVANPKDVANYFKIAGGKTGDDPLDGESLGILFGDIPALPNSIENNSKNGNIIVHVGHGDTNALAIGSTNIMVKVGDGGSKAIALGDNNIIVRVGNAAGTKQAADIAGYRAFEGVQIAFGDRNMVINHGKSNDIILALDPNILRDEKCWDQIGKAMNPFPSYIKSDADKAEEEKKGKETTDIFGRKYNSKTDHEGYLDAEKRNGFGFEGALGFSSLFKEGPGKIWDDLTKQRMDNRTEKAEVDDTPEPYGNFVYGGEGSDIILAVGTNNIVFSDSWTSLGDFNLEMLYDASGTNKTISSLGAKLGTFGDMLGSRSMGLGNIPVVGPMLDKLDVSAGFKWLPRTDIGSLTGLKGDATGDVQFDGSDVGRNWANAGLGAPNFEFTTPKIWTNVAGLVKNIVSIAKNEDLTHKGQAYTSDHDKGKEFFSGWKNGITEVISTIGVPELLSSINARDGEGRNVWQRFFDSDTAIGWGSMWKDPTGFWDGVNLLQKNSDIVSTIGMNNIVFTGEGGDMVLSIGTYNSVALGDGRDISLSWGADNRVAGGNDNDMLIGVGANNLQMGGAGNDLVIGLGEKNRLTGDGGDDMIVAIGVSNTVLAGEGNDFVVAVGKDNYISAGGGDDLIIGIGANNTYNMGGGNDVIINLGFASQSFYGDGSDIGYARGIGNFLDGEEGADVFYLDQPSQHNRVHGSAGNDTFYLGGRDNVVNGGENNDTFVIRKDVERVTVEDLASNDRIVIDNSVKISDIWLSRRESDLLMEIDRWDRAGSQTAPEIPVGELRVKNWFSSASNRSNLFFDQQRTPSGNATATAKMLGANQVNALVDAMASFTRADASGNFRDNMNTPAQSTIASLWSTARTVDSFSVKAA
jgi:RTX toxin RtxA